MSRKLGSDEGKKSPLNMRTTQELRAALERAAAASDRSLTQEAEARLEQSFDPVHVEMLRAVSADTKTGEVLGALLAVMSAVSFDEGGLSPFVARAALLSAFDVILNEYFPDPSGLMADLFHPKDKAVSARAADRFAAVTRSILEARRVTQYADKDPAPGLTLLQTAQVLGLLPTETKEAARLLKAAADRVLEKKVVSAG